MRKVRLFRVNIDYHDIEEHSCATLALGAGVDEWVEISDDDFNLLNTYDSRFRLRQSGVILVELLPTQEVQKEIQKIHTFIADRRAEEEKARKRREEEKRRRARTLQERKRKQLEKLKKELGEA